MKPATPDIPPLSLVAVAGSVVGVATAFGAPIPDEAGREIVNTVQILGPALVAQDFGLRFVRAKYGIFDKEPGPQAPPVPPERRVLYTLAIATGIFGLISLTALILVLT